MRHITRVHEPNSKNLQITAPTPKTTFKLSTSKITKTTKKTIAMVTATLLKQAMMAARTTARKTT